VVYRSSKEAAKVLIEGKSKYAGGGRKLNFPMTNRGGDSYWEVHGVPRERKTHRGRREKRGGNFSTYQHLHMPGKRVHSPRGNR